jgi:hypothetical protein
MEELKSGNLWRKSCSPAKQFKITILKPFVFLLSFADTTDEIHLSLEPLVQAKGKHTENICNLPTTI